MMGLVATNSPCPLISKYSIHEKERGWFRIKMEASQIILPEKKVKAIVENLARDRSLKEPPICTFLDVIWVSLPDVMWVSLISSMFLW